MMLALPTKTGLALLTALDQVGEASLAHLATATRVPLTTAQSAVERLEHLGFVREARRRRYELVPERTALLVRYALQSRDGVEIAMRANPSVLFAGRDNQGYLVAIRSQADRAAAARLRDRLVDTPHQMTIIDISEMTPRQSYALRERAEEAALIAGDARRAFPRPPRAGRARGRALLRPHPDLRLPSARALNSLARNYGISRLVIFGSTVREDFDLESDVDVLVETKPGEKLGVTRLTRLENELSTLFGREVEVLTPTGLRPEIVRDIAREGVAIYG